MPKSYLPDEPGAMRGLEHDFDPYAQVKSRIEALEILGHPTDKIELLILGGTWCSYRRDYQEWFVSRCFDAMNEPPLARLYPPILKVKTRRANAGISRGTTSLNETATHRNVGLVIETRPDEITPDESAGCVTWALPKYKWAAQSLDDRILEMNKRGHDVECTRRATALLRAAGFKIVLHWMPNLLGATPESDREDFARLMAGLLSR